MDFGLSDEQRILIGTVRAFIRAELQPLEQEIEDTGMLAPEIARAIFEKSYGLGLYAMNIPAEFGGGGLSAVDTMLVEEEFGPYHRRPDPARLRQCLRGVAGLLGRADRALAAALRPR